MAKSKFAIRNRINKGNKERQAMRDAMKDMEDVLDIFGDDNEEPTGGAIRDAIAHDVAVYCARKEGFAWVKNKELIAFEGVGMEEE